MCGRGPPIKELKNKSARVVKFYNDYGKEWQMAAMLCKRQDDEEQCSFL